jgi:hypothetical protein
VTAWLIAPAGTPAGAPGWRKPPPGTVLTWTVHGGAPDCAVQAGGVLISTGVPWLPPVPLPPLVIPFPPMTAAAIFRAAGVARPSITGWPDPAAVRITGCDEYPRG